MSPASRTATGRVARFALLHILLLATFHLVVGPIQVGSPLTVSTVGGVLGAVFGGLWLGARVAARLRVWSSCRSGMPHEPLSMHGRAVWRDVLPLLIVWGCGLVATLVWSLWTKSTLIQVTLAHAVLAATLVAAAGVAIWVEALVHARRLALAYGSVLWALGLSAFLWAPAVVEHSRGSLEIAVLVNPGAGVLSALGRQNIFWVAALYGALPYADYGVRLAHPAAHALGWSAIGAGLIAIRVLWARHAWAGLR
ncbi:hypothetical protein HN371_14155 [Candidatus Poribacteria bacterium]|nr:hypothetical protein [Candidatus Poribacteria bacterium]MBT5534927.1 hypothetical protein [Candidatus Poribacteria bacterium]MBT7099674.1 hypothetical protein [Candidatus Poribacteria bacterium]MBT7806127.1 hypothetical protein [Candidatus Poribacteria bacterium]